MGRRGQRRSGYAAADVRRRLTACVSVREGTRVRARCARWIGGQRLCGRRERVLGTRFRGVGSYGTRTTLEARATRQTSRSSTSGSRPHTGRGLAAAVEIRCAYPDVGVLVLSQYVEVGVALQLVAEFAERGYLLKDRIRSKELGLSGGEGGGRKRKGREGGGAEQTAAEEAHRMVRAGRRSEIELLWAVPGWSCRMGTPVSV